ncbi:hypothetical protein DFR58_14013 [Anaerobacterium chartisolvens]|uniref:PH (Pleckstrin Homology) domain-containing protein n=1 Tax=Anaerobacterium chartisolvens TaxID=1297424 RepID=A0A369AHR6_9FIRM|nr:DUF6106 family protein [Anaerobacterium chartisolvens]RCX08902.1 hypothetical protein DFR58_14013 [Anaerobacterium chartisolvens]
MDVFIEQIISKKKNTQDVLVNAGIIAAGLILSLVIFSIPYIQSFAIFLFAGIAFGVYYLITSRNIEFEYILTNGELDIDKIISRRKRKRVFSASCKDFDIVARVSSDKFTNEVKGIRKKLELAGSMSSPDVYFATLNLKGERTLLLFEPQKKMLDSFKTYIPRKVFE